MHNLIPIPRMGKPRVLWWDKVSRDFEAVKRIVVHAMPDHGPLRFNGRRDDAAKSRRVLEGDNSYSD